MFDLIKKIKNLFTSPPKNTFKIIDVRKNIDCGQLDVHYQICGKAAASHESVKALFETMFCVNGFSKEDSMQLLKLYVKQCEKAPLRLVNFMFSESSTKCYIKDIRTNNIFPLKADDIINSEKLCTQLSNEHLRLIYHQYLTEQEAKRTKTIKPHTNELNRKKAKLTIVKSN